MIAMDSAVIRRLTTVNTIQGGTNWNVYCSNNPLSMVDPTGLNSFLSLLIPTSPLSKNYKCPIY